MTQDTASPRSRLIGELRASGQELAEKLRDIPAESLEKGCYENGWNARQVLAHVASIEWTYPRLIEVARDAGQEAEKKADPPQRTAKGGIGSYNDRMVERYAGSSVPELLEVFETNRAATIAAVEAADEALFDVPIKSAGGITGPLATVYNMVAVLHVRGHLKDILTAANG